MGNPWAESDWQDLLGEEVQVDQEYKRTSAVLILNDKGILKFVLEYLLNNVNSATGKYCILYFNQPLMELGPIDVVKIQALLVQVDSIQDKTTAWFGESIYQASSIMKKEKTLKNIVVITKVDPFTTDTEVTQVAVKSDDLVKSKIKVHLLGMSDKVDFKKFKRLNPQCFVEDQVWTPSDFERLKDNLKEIRDGKAVALDLLFYLSDKVVIGLKGYKNIVEMKVPTGQKIDPRSRRPVKNKVAYLDSLTAKELTKSQIAYYYSFGGEKCVFTKAEIDHIKDWGTPSVCLIGFRPCSALKDKFNVTTSYFGVPNEARIPGSTSVMAHLIDRMLNKGVIGFGTMVAKKGAALRLVAIIPSIQGGDRFNLVPLPFADEMRPIPSSIVDLRIHF